MTLYAALRAEGGASGPSAEGGASGPSAEGLVRVTDSPPPVDEALLRGDGVFETILVHRHGTATRVIDLAEHLARLRLSADLLGFLIPPAAHWHAAVDALLAADTPAADTPAAVAAANTSADTPSVDRALRLTATRAGTYFASVSPLPDSVAAQRAGISVILAADPFNRNAPFATTAAKTLSYATNLAALRHARASGADDVIFHAADGTITETPTATVVLARGGALYTPQAPNLLPSITAARLAPTPTRTSAHDLLEADAVYLVSALRLAAPVTAIDGQAVAVDPALHERILRMLL